MTPEELKKFLAPDMFDCTECKKQYNTWWEANACADNDQRIREKREKDEQERIEREKRKSEKLLEKLEEVL